MGNNRATGTVYEQLAQEYLRQRGYEILVCNYRCRFGEIDLIARENGYFVFVEVKYRKTPVAGMPVEAVNYYKQKNICKVAKYYMLKHGLTEQTPVRFDIVAVLGTEISVIQNAFEYVGE